MFFCPIKRSFQGFILSKGSSLRLWKWLKISWCSSLKTKKASSYSQLELEPVLKSKAIDYLLPCVQSKWSKKVFSVYYWSFFCHKKWAVIVILTREINYFQILLIPYPVKVISFIKYLFSGRRTRNTTGVYLVLQEIWFQTAKSENKTIQALTGTRTLHFSIISLHVCRLAPLSCFHRLLPCRGW